MCFSAQASFVVATGLLVLGSLTYVKARASRLRILASIPLLFALQQACEFFVWITLNKGDTTSILHTYSVYGFLFFALLFWPVWIPALFCHLEQKSIRNNIILASLCFGCLFVSAALMWMLWYNPTASIVDHHIVYTFSKPLPILWQHIALLVYFIAAVLPLFIASIDNLWLLGTIIAGALVIIYLFFYLVIVSLWCFFSAVASALIYGIVSRNQLR